MDERLTAVFAGTTYLHHVVTTFAFQAGRLGFNTWSDL
jgi:hypothetical protein